MNCAADAPDGYRCAATTPAHVNCQACNQPVPRRDNPPVPTRCGQSSPRPHRVCVVWACCTPSPGGIRIAAAGWAAISVRAARKVDRSEAGQQCGQQCGLLLANGRPPHSAGFCGKTICDAYRRYMGSATGCPGGRLSRLKDHPLPEVRLISGTKEMITHV